MFDKGIISCVTIDRISLIDNQINTTSYGIGNNNPHCLFTITSSLSKSKVKINQSFLTSAQILERRIRKCSVSSVQQQESDRHSNMYFPNVYRLSLGFSIKLLMMT